jgi:hypothetical protein
LPLCGRTVEIRRDNSQNLYYFCPGLKNEVGCNGRVNFGDLSDPADIPGFRSYKDGADPRDDGDGGAAAAAPVTLRKDAPAVDPAAARNVTPPTPADEGEGWGIDF